MIEQGKTRYPAMRVWNQQAIFGKVCHPYTVRIGLSAKPVFNHIDSIRVSDQTGTKCLSGGLPGLVVRRSTDATKTKYRQ